MRVICYANTLRVTFDVSWLLLYGIDPSSISFGENTLGENLCRKVQSLVGLATPD